MNIDFDKVETVYSNAYEVRRLRIAWWVKAHLIDELKTATNCN